MINGAHEQDASALIQSPMVRPIMDHPQARAECRSPTEPDTQNLYALGFEWLYSVGQCQNLFLSQHTNSLWPSLSVTSNIHGGAAAACCAVVPPPLFHRFYLRSRSHTAEDRKTVFLKNKGYSFWLQHGNWGFQYFQYIVQMRIQQRPFFRRFVAMLKLAVS